MAPEYYGNPQHDALVASLAKTLSMDSNVLKRLIDTIYNDPQVHQLWSYVESSYPAQLAKPIAERSKSIVPSPPAGT
jgi:hypothetical protein